MPATALPSGPARRTACARACLTLLVVLVLLATGGAGAGRAAALTVTRSPVGPPIPAGFLGISTQYKALESYTGSDPGSIDQGFLNLLSDIAPGQRPVLRIGGDSADWSWYPIRGQRRPPGVTYTITPNLLKVARATAVGLNGKLILDVNLEAENKAITSGDARAMVAAVGNRYIEGMEIGNEPELYHHFAWYHTPQGTPVPGRSADWTPAKYRAEFAAFAKLMPRTTIAGPVSGIGTWLEQLGTFLRDEPSVGLTTIHAYPLKHCRASHVVTIGNVLSDAASQGFVSILRPYIDISHRDGRPIRIDELNAVSCGGTRGVSDSFATSLWMVDTLFGLARAGADGINVNSTPGAINAVLDPVDGHAGSGISVQPAYYGMMLFAQAAPPGARIVRVRGSLPSGLKAWATLDADGTERLVLINQSAAQAQSATVQAPGAAGPATVESLHAHGLASTDGVTLGGQGFGASTTTGELSGQPARRLITPFTGSYTVPVPAASVQMVTFTPPPGTLLLSALAAHTLIGSLLPAW